MAGSFKLTYSGTDITLSPLSRSTPRFDIDGKGIINKTMLDGTQRVHTSYLKRYFEFEVNDVSKTNADYINLWKQSAYTIVLTPNTDDAGTTYDVIIVNDSKPLMWMPGTAPDTKCQGLIMLREV